jgi:hypothetical protein
MSAIGVSPVVTEMLTRHRCPFAETRDFGALPESIGVVAVATQLVAGALGSVMAAAGVGMTERNWLTPAHAERGSLAAAPEQVLTAAGASATRRVATAVATRTTRSE